MAKKAASFASRKLSPVKMKRGKQHCAALSSCVFAPTVLFTYLCFLFRCEIIHDVELLANLLGKQVCTKSDSISSGSYIPSPSTDLNLATIQESSVFLPLIMEATLAQVKSQKALDVLSQEGGPSFTHMTCSISLWIDVDQWYSWTDVNWWWFVQSKGLIL